MLDAGVLGCRRYFRFREPCVRGIPARTQKDMWRPEGITKIMCGPELSPERWLCQFMRPR